MAYILLPILRFCNILMVLFALEHVLKTSLFFKSYIEDPWRWYVFNKILGWKHRLRQHNDYFRFPPFLRLLILLRLWCQHLCNFWHGRLRNLDTVFLWERQDHLERIRSPYFCFRVFSATQRQLQTACCLVRTHWRSICRFSFCLHLRRFQV